MNRARLSDHGGDWEVFDLRPTPVGKRCAMAGCKLTGPRRGFLGVGLAGIERLAIIRPPQNRCPGWSLPDACLLGSTIEERSRSCGAAIARVKFVQSSAWREGFRAAVSVGRRSLGQTLQASRRRPLSRAPPATPPVRIPGSIPTICWPAGPGKKRFPLSNSPSARLVRVPPQIPPSPGWMPRIHWGRSLCRYPSRFPPLPLHLHRRWPPRTLLRGRPRSHQCRQAVPPSLCRCGRPTRRKKNCRPSTPIDPRSRCIRPTRPSVLPISPGNRFRTCRVLPVGRRRPLCSS